MLRRLVATLGLAALSVAPSALAEPPVASQASAGPAVPPPSSSACAPPGALECPVYERYVNHKYGFSVDVPAFFAKKAADADGRGQPFELGTKVRIRAWAMFDNPPMTVQQLYGDWTRRDGVTFKTLAMNTWVVRGHEGQRLYYTRSILADGIICTIEVSYEKDVGDAIEPLLARMGATLMPIPGEGIRGKSH
jgi:hypothetical protein